MWFVRIVGALPVLALAAGFASTAFAQQPLPRDPLDFPAVLGPRAVPAPPMQPAPLIEPGFTSVPLGQPPLPRPVPVISWQVDNPFRFFTDAADTALHRATYEGLSDIERNSPVLSAEQALASRHPDGWAVATRARTCWNGTRNAHACPTGSAYINPASHVIVAQLKGVRDKMQVDCTWRSAPFADAGAKKETKVIFPCDVAVKLTIPYPTGASVSVEIGGQVVAQSIVHVQDIFIVGMGDSFASGEGNPDQPVRFSRERTADYGASGQKISLAGYPARIGAWKQIGDDKFIEENALWLDQACHRSLYSHQLRAALQLAIETPHRAVTFVGVSCSGAETTFGLFLLYKGNEWVPTPPELSQISAVATAQCGKSQAPSRDLPEAYHLRNKLPELNGLVLRKCDSSQARKIDLLFLSVGGNDVGFSRLVANAVLGDKSTLRWLGGWMGQIHGEVEAKSGLSLLPYRYKSLNRAIHNILHVPWSEPSRVILTSYPRMSVLMDGRTVCPDGNAGMTVAPEFSLSRAKAAESEKVAQQLHSIMRRAARDYKWSFVDAHRERFLGHSICAGAGQGAFTRADDLRMPRMVNGRWEPYNPADWRAYEPRRRWFRTPNDAFMTGNFHVSASLMQKVLKLPKLLWFQLMLASTYSGAFHPTAEGQAAIADALVVKARDVLAAYDEDSGGR